MAYRLMGTFGRIHTVIYNRLLLQPGNDSTYFEKGEIHSA